ncbi:MAG: tetratricopeptide repeat protein [Desulfobulbaceae bacterium]|nr:tetratricopeptide repeat protein [Desulfobulbaceae bacterium]
MTRKSGRDENPRVAVELLLVLMVPLAVFLQVAWHEFLSYDDPSNIYQNPHISDFSLTNLLYFWQGPHLRLYIPLTYNFWLLLAKLSQLLPFADGEPAPPHLFHLANLLLHLGSTALAFLIIRSLLNNARAAAAGALLFAIHPIQVEPVAWASAMKDLLSGFWSLLALWQYILFAQASARSHRVGHYLLAILSFSLALLAKPSAVVIPLLAGLVGWLILNRNWRWVLVELSPWLLSVVPVVLITTRAQAWVAHVYKPPAWQRLLVAGDTISFYLSKLILPLTLGPDYGRLPQLILNQDWVYFTGTIPYLLALALLWKASRPELAAAGLFLIPLLPVLGIQPFAFQAISTVADRYLYLAMLGPALATSLIFSRYQSNKYIWAIMLTILALWAAKSTIQTSYWKNPLVFETHALQVNPQSWNAYLRYGVAKSLGNDKEAAITAFRKALAIKPDFAEAHYNLGVVYSDLGQNDQAISSHTQAFYINPRYIPAALGLGGLYLKSAQYDQAIMYFLIAVNNDPDPAEYHVRLGESYAGAGRDQEAIASFQQALSRQPNYIEAYYRLGVIYQKRQESDLAIASYRKVLELSPDSAETYNNLGVIFREQGKSTEAAANFQQAITISPGLPSALKNLQILSQEKGR